MDASSKNNTEFLDTLVKDGPDVIYKLSQAPIPDGDRPIEILADLPAAIDIDIILGHVKRWREIQLYFNRPLRVYAWSSQLIVEKYVLGCMQRLEQVSMTVLPTYLKECKKNGK